MKKKRTVIIILAIFILNNLFTVTVEAKTYRYAASMVTKSDFKKNQRNGYASLYKAKFSGNKLIIYGTLDKSKVSKNTLTRTTRLSNRKRTYKLSKNVKYYAGFGQSVGKRRFNYLMTRYNGLGLVFIVKNGKIVQMTMCS